MDVYILQRSLEVVLRVVALYSCVAIELASRVRYPRSLLLYKSLEKGR